MRTLVGWKSLEVEAFDDEGATIASVRVLTRIEAEVQQVAWYRAGAPNVVIRKILPDCPKCNKPCRWQGDPCWEMGYECDNLDCELVGKVVFG